jgi:PDZ domain
MSCRNAREPVILQIRLYAEHGGFQNLPKEYRDDKGNAVLRNTARCTDGNLQTITVHVPGRFAQGNERKLKANVSVLGTDNELLEGSKLFDIHLPKVSKDDSTTMVAFDLPPGWQVDSEESLRRVAGASTDLPPNAATGKSSSSETTHANLPDITSSSVLASSFARRPSPAPIVAATHPKRAYLGAHSLQPLAISRDGVEISTVEPQGPASIAGLRAGDFITAINGKFVTTLQQLTDEIDSLPAGSKIPLRFRRGAALYDVSVTLSERRE